MSHERNHPEDQNAAGQNLRAMANPRYAESPVTDVTVADPDRLRDPCPDFANRDGDGADDQRCRQHRDEHQARGHVEHVIVETANDEIRDEGHEHGHRHEYGPDVRQEAAAFEGRLDLLRRDIVKARNRGDQGRVAGLTNFAPSRRADGPAASTFGTLSTNGRVAVSNGELLCYLRINAEVIEVAGVRKIQSDSRFRCPVAVGVDPIARKTGGRASCRQNNPNREQNIRSRGCSPEPLDTVTQRFGVNVKA